MAPFGEKAGMSLLLLRDSVMSSFNLSDNQIKSIRTVLKASCSHRTIRIDPKACILKCRLDTAKVERGYRAAISRVTNGLKLKALTSKTEVNASPIALDRKKLCHVNLTKSLNPSTVQVWFRPAEGAR